MCQMDMILKLSFVAKSKSTVYCENGHMATLYAVIHLTAAVGGRGYNKVDRMIVVSTSKRLQKSVPRPTNKFAANYAAQFVIICQNDKKSGRKQQRQ